MAIHIPPLSDVDLRQLRVFRAVVERGGFTQAQDELGVSRSTISAQMAALETRLGLTLCRRGRSGFALTEHGQRIYAETIKCLASLENFRSEVGAMRGRLVGELRIGAVDAIVGNEHCRLDEAIAAFNERVPDVHVTLAVVSPNQIENAVLNRQIEIAIVPNQPMNAAVHLQQLFHEEQNLYCGDRHPLFAVEQKRLTLERVSELNYARRGYAIATGYHSLFANTPGATAYSMEGIAHLILGGRFVGFLPKHYARQWLEAGRMRPLRPDLLTYNIALCVAHFPVSALSQVGGIFRECLLEAHRTKA
ncbi:LysR family transcriptional regulator [Rhizobium halophytocola]|uniref:DNA-binding transcriptional LysR family regulator n=1 Tax=Rhizobium halophytocola TaxID=735519 RepID=A0ABS4E229_9HYPH|nr:LysR family transcriptional regulator [Rhizobium halophytocola]MBP1852005.1 DNA-binding transcriptional LysR family regulator [Rhizobium halophytocola]